MFSMGRFDPRLEDAKSIQKVKEKKKIKRDREKEQKHPVPKKNVKDSIQIIEEPTISQEKSYESDSSSSAPSSEGSSSSAPSSDDESSDQEDEPALKVIAPEQKFVGVETKRRRLNITNEGIDDFDQETIENVDNTTKKNDEVETALKISKMATHDAAKLWKLAPFLIKNLEEDGYDSFFPIQALVIPDVIASETHAHIRNRDVCVAAPTGSGKTLAFVLPVLNSLASRRIKRLRALVVLPSRDLATQVYNVFERYSKGSDLSIGLAIGQTDFEAEQTSLIVDQKKGTIDSSREFHRYQYVLQPFSVKNALQAFSFSGIDDGIESSLAGCWSHGDLKNYPDLCKSPCGGSSTVDVLVCTPGRLMDHLEKTPGFTLQHLRFLVIDEADRLVNQSYQNWIRRVVKAASAGPEQLAKNRGSKFDLGELDPVTWRRDVDVGEVAYCDQAPIDISVCRPVQLRKLLFSATLTKDPRKLASLGLVNPKHFDAHHLQARSSENANVTNQTSYSLPERLSEFTVECSAEQKPLVLLSYLIEQGMVDEKNQNNDGIVVVFTSSVDSTHRLTRLLQLLWGAGGYGPTSCVAEFSSALTQKQRSLLMKRCNNTPGQSSKVRVMVCSDGMSRGMDIASVGAVVNYDVPSFAKTYVHRCGRTARAGRSGKAITIAKSGQLVKFRKMRQLIDYPQNVKEKGIRKDLVSDIVPVYKKCVRTLKKIMKAEENNQLSAIMPLTEEWIP